MLLTCWKIAYVRGLQPALGAHTPVLLQPHGVTDSLQCSSFHASPGQASVQALRQPSISVRLRSRTGWLLPLSSLASGVGLAWYLDPGSSRGPTEVQCLYYRRFSATLDSAMICLTRQPARS